MQYNLILLGFCQVAAIMQGYFFVAATIVYAAFKWRYILRKTVPAVAEEIDHFFGDVLTLRTTAVPLTSAVLAFISSGVVLFNDDGFFMPASSPTKMAYVVLAVAAFSVWVPDSTRHSLTVNSACFILAAYNLRTSPRGFWWTIFILQGLFYAFGLVTMFRKVTFKTALGITQQ